MVAVSDPAPRQPGYVTGLQPSMGSVGTLFITVSVVAPSIAVFIVGSDVIRQVGSGVSSRRPSRS